MHPRDLPVTVADGTGTPLVLVHGWIGSRASWDLVLPHLDLPGPVVRYDQRCHGDAPCTPFDLDTLAADLQHVIDTHCDEPPVVAGHSMGGMVALTHAVTHGSTAGLVLLGTCASTPEPARHSPAWFLDRLDTMPRDDWAERIADNYLPDGPAHLHDATVQELVAADDRPLRDGLDAMVRYDVRDDLPGLDVDAHVVGGTRDGAITPAKTRELADLLDTDPVMLDASHLMLQETPAAVASHIARSVEAVR